MLVLPMKEYISGSTSGIDWMDSTKLSRETSHIASFTEMMQGKREYQHKNAHIKIQLIIRVFNVFIIH